MVVALLRLEAAVVFALGAFMLFKALTSESEAPLAAVGVVLFAALGGAGLLLAAKAFATNTKISPTVEQYQKALIQSYILNEGYARQ